MSQHVAVYPRDAVSVKTHNLTLTHHRVPGSSVARRVVGSNSTWDSDFFRVYVSARICVISCRRHRRMILYQNRVGTLPPSKMDEIGRGSRKTIVLVGERQFLFETFRRL